jgi:hypothetical protein
MVDAGDDEQAHEVGCLAGVGGVERVVVVHRVLD